MSENPEMHFIPEQRWYFVQVVAGQEKQALANLTSVVAASGLMDKFGEMFIPKEEVIEIKKGKKRKSDRKFFPGYILVRMYMDEKTWTLVRHTPRVLGFIGGAGNKPIPISDEEADRIIKRVQEGVDKPKPKTLFEVGETVRIIQGPFTDFTGIVEDVNYDKSRLRVAVLIFGRSTPVELEFTQVEKG